MESAIALSINEKGEGFIYISADSSDEEIAKALIYAAATYETSKKDAILAAEQSVKLHKQHRESK